MSINSFSYLFCLGVLISFGGVIYCDGDMMSSLFDCVDNVLYCVKNFGKNSYYVV